MAHQAQDVHADAANGSDEPGVLFKNIRFFLIARLPSRSVFREQVEQNGGLVVKLEKNADIIIADHARKDSPPGSYSYTWIEACIREEALVDKEPHLATRVPVKTPRPVGAVAPGSSRRMPYTKEDDILLYRWVQLHTQNGMRSRGNDIYKELEKVNNRHPFQSWRDRYLKFVRDNPPAEALNGSDIALPSLVANVVTPAPPILRATQPLPEQEDIPEEHDQQHDTLSQPPPQPDDDVEPQAPVMPSQPPQITQSNPSSSLTARTSLKFIMKDGNEEFGFPQDVIDWLLVQSRDIVNVPPSHEEDAWQGLVDTWALDNPGEVVPSTRLWRRCFDLIVRPKLERTERMVRLRDSLQSRSSLPGPASNGSARHTPDESIPSETRVDPKPNGVSSAKKRSHEELQSAMPTRRSPKSPNTPKRVRYDLPPLSPERDVDHSPGPARSPIKPMRSPANPRQAPNVPEGVEVIELADQHEEGAEGTEDGAAGPIYIWQEDQFNEDDKENVPRHPLAPVPDQGTTLVPGQPGEALEAFMPEPVHFRLEPATSSFQAIDEFSDYESQRPEEQEQDYEQAAPLPAAAETQFEDAISQQPDTSPEPEAIIPQLTEVSVSDPISPFHDAPEAQQPTTTALANEEEQQADVDEFFDPEGLTGMPMPADLPPPDAGPSSLPPWDMDTQALLDQGTQIPDFDVPRPPSSSPDLESPPIPSSPPLPNGEPTTPPPPTATNEPPAAHRPDEATLDEWVQWYTARYDRAEGDVLEVLDRTMHNVPLAKRVLAEWAEGDDMPNDVRGCWTAEDDAILVGGNARGLEALERFHGSASYEQRVEWLNRAAAP